MSKVKVKLDSTGISAVMKSAGAAAQVEPLARRVCAAANGMCSPDGLDEEPFKSGCAVAGDRYRAWVTTATGHGRNAARKGYLSRALKSVRR